MIYYREGLKYQLARDHVEAIGIHPVKAIETDWIRLSPEGQLSIRSGYAWDGPSGPTIDTPSAMTGSLVHDALYQLIRLGYLPPFARGAADKEYRRICLRSGMWKARAVLHFDALRWAGGSSAAPDAERPVLTAP